jgi:hypothetical protein
MIVDFSNVINESGWDNCKLVIKKNIYIIFYGSQTTEIWSRYFTLVPMRLRTAVKNEGSAVG